MAALEPPPQTGASASLGRATGDSTGLTQDPPAPPMVDSDVGTAKAAYSSKGADSRGLALNGSGGVEDLEAGKVDGLPLACVSSHSGHSHDGNGHGHGHEDGHGHGHGHGHDHEHGCGHKHYSNRAPWLRAALLGAQDGLISVSSLMIGVGAIKEDRNSMVISGLAGLVAGACSMAIGEYVSVYGQRDIEEADINAERAEFAKGPAAVARELEELTQIYVARGLQYPLAKQVATELSAVDPIRAHARDELGIDMDDMSNPFQAALASAVCFVTGAIVPLLSAAFIATYWIRILVVLIVSTLMFIGFGVLGAYLGGARRTRAALRTTVGGLVAIGITYGILRAFGTTYA